MGQFTPIAFIAANAVGSLAQQRNAGKLAKQQAQYDNAALEIEARRQRNEAQALDAADVQAGASQQRQAAYEAEDRRRRLARAQAAERASFAGRGVSQEGSGGAVLRSLLDEHERIQAEASLDLSDRLETIRRGQELRRQQLELGQLGVSQRQQWNLLQASARQRDARLNMFRTAANAGASAYAKWPSS